MSRSIGSVLLVIAALTMLGHAEGSKADGFGDQVVGQVRVDLAGVDLRDGAAAKALLTRLQGAAWQACGGDPQLHASYARKPVRTEQVFRECRERAVKRAVEDIGTPHLKQIYADSLRAERVHQAKR
jgi:UrcA family protein